MAQDLPTPQSRSDKLLYSIAAGQTTDLPTPQSRSDEFMMAIITGDTSDLPTPQSRQEKYLKEIAYHSGGGGLKEVTTVEELESKLIKDNEGNVYHYSGETSGDYVKGNLYQVKTVNNYPYFVYYGYIPVYMINVTTENVTADPDNLPIIRPDGSVTLAFTADGEEWVVPYSAPVVTGANSVYIRVSDTEATITLTNPTADIEVEVVGIKYVATGLIDGDGSLVVLYEDSGWDVTLDFASSTKAQQDLRSGYQTMLRYPSTRKVVLPPIMNRIGSRTLAYISSVPYFSVIIPNSVTEIASSAFYGCSKLQSITIPDSVTSIGADAFYNCTSLTIVTFEGTPSKISTAFYNVVRDIYVPWAQGAVSGAPWGATNATIHYNWTPTT